MFTGRVFNNSKVLLIPLLAVLFTTPALLSGCSGGSGQPGADGATQADVGLSFPKGYTYDPATGALYPPSGENYASLPPYVTGITLIISGEDMDDQVYQVNLSTLTVTFTVTPGIRVFTIIVTTSFGITFTDSITVEVVNGSPLSLNFNLNINVPPSGVSATAQPTLAKPGDVIALSCHASDLDPGDKLTYDWSGPGGWTATGPDTTFTIPHYGSFTFTCTVSDGWGGRASASATVSAPPPNKPPVVKSVSIVEWSTKLPPPWGYMTPGDPADIGCVAFDPDGNQLTYTIKDQFGVLANGPSAKNVPAPNLGTCKVLFEDWVITCKVSDGRGGSASGTAKMPVGWCF